MTILEIRKVGVNIGGPARLGVSDLELLVNGVKQPFFSEVEFGCPPVETFSQDGVRRFVPGDDTVITIRVRGGIVRGGRTGDINATEWRTIRCQQCGTQTETPIQENCFGGSLCVDCLENTAEIYKDQLNFFRKLEEEKHEHSP